MFSKLFGWFKRHKILAGILILAVLVLGVQAKYWYEDYRIEQVHKSIAENQNWDIVGGEEYGNQLCEKTCVGETRVYIPEHTIDDYLGQFTRIIQDNGFRVTSRDKECGSRPVSNITTTICSVEGETKNLELSIALDMNNDANNSRVISVILIYKYHLFGLFR